MATHKGKLFGIQLDTSGTHSPATWVTIPQRRAGEITNTTDTVDNGTADNGVWTSKEPISNSWGITLEAVFDAGDPTLSALQAAWEAQTIEWYQVDESAVSGQDREGQAIITQWNRSIPHDNIVTVSITLEGIGAFTDTV